jgi:hypothetical protein
LIASYTPLEQNIWSQKSPSLVKVGEGALTVEMELEATTGAENKLLVNYKV